MGSSQYSEGGTLADFHHKALFTILTIAVVVVFLWLLASSLTIIPLILTSILIAVLIKSLAHPLSERLPVSERWLVIVVAGALFGLAGGFAALAGPQVAQQFGQLAERLPESMETIDTRLRENGLDVDLSHSFNQVSSDSANANLFARLSGFFSGIFGITTDLLLVVVAGIYLAFEPSIYVDNFLRLFPQNYQDRAAQILSESHDILQRWLLSRMIAGIVVGILTFVGLTLIDMPLALTLAIIAGVLTFVPTIGPALSAIPAILIGLTQSVSLVVLVIVVYVLVQVIENYLVTPNIQRETVQLPPALVMLSQAFFGLLFGWMGLFVAAPMVAVLIVLVKSVYVEGILGRDVGPVVE